jgi:hypothetical protein
VKIKKHLYTVGENANWYTMEDSMEIPPKTKIELPFDLVIPFLDYIT